MAQAVASADIMLTPSTTETFGNVVLEAMASGLAVVSADAPSARSLIVDNDSGMLCAPDGVDGYVAAITALLDSREQRAALGRRACAASAAYDWDAASGSVENAYAEAIAAFRRPD